MTIDATQTQGLNRELTRGALSAGPRGKVELDSKDDRKTQGADGEKSFSLFGNDGLSFWDVLDVFNPLQHIPLLNSVYREVTGDQITPAAKLVGGTLFGGLYGLGAAAIDVVVQGMTGKDVGEHAVALASGATESSAETSRLADVSDPSSPWLAYAETTAAVAAVAARADESAVPDETQAAESPAVAQTAAALATTEPTMKVSAAKASGDIPLPTWETPPAAPAAQPAVAAASPATREGKSFPMPQRRNAHADSPRPLNELRANASGKTALPSGLSEQAMRAAGLTPDRIQEVMKTHGASASAEQTAEIGSAQSAGGVDSMWFYSAMNQALDKYRAAGSLAGNGDAVSAVTAVR